MKKVVLSAFLAFSLGANAQKVSNKLQFQKGQKLEMTTTLKSVSDMMGQSINVNVVSTRGLHVTDASKNAATLENNIKRLQVDFDGMGKNETYDSDKESDRNSQMGKSLEKGLKNKYTMTVDASGKVTGVQAPEDNPNKTTDSADSQDMMSGMMDGLMEGFSLPEVGDASDFAILPAREIVKGDSWIDTTSKDKDEKRKSNYTVSDINNNDIVLDFTEEVNTKTTKENMGMEVTIDKLDKNTGKIILDRKTGLLKQKTVSTQTSGTASVMGQEIPLDSKTTKTVVVTAGK